jgi:hypothetical protein
LVAGFDPLRAAAIAAGGVDAYGLCAPPPPVMPTGGAPTRPPPPFEPAVAFDIGTLVVEEPGKAPG